MHTEPTVAITNAITITIAPDHPAFAGHFPGLPIVPGVVLLEETMHAIEVQTGRSLARCRFESIKFKHVVRPGEPVELRWVEAAKGCFRFDLYSSDRWIANGTLTLAPSAGDCHAD